MAITTLDGALAGFQPGRALLKNSTATTPTAAAQRGYSLWYTPGIPGASTVNAAGINGTALTPASSAVEGRMTRANPTSGLNAHLGRLSLQPSQAGNLWLVDRLWHNSGLSVTLTTAQSITPAALPARDAAGTTNGDGVLAALEWSTAAGSTGTTSTLSYTNQAGTAGRTATHTNQASSIAGSFEIFSLQAGDTGIRSVQSFTNAATRTSGVAHLVLFRIIAVLDVPFALSNAMMDPLTGGLPRIYDDSVLQTVFWPSSATAFYLTGHYLETHG